MRIKAFRAVRPRPDIVSCVACVPYDTVDTAEARKLADQNRHSFLRVIRAEIELPDSIDPYADDVYARAVQNYRRLRDDGVLVREQEPCLYVYRQKDGRHVQHGVVCCCHIDDYTQNLIRRHEEIRHDKVRDRTRLIAALDANVGPVFLTYRDRPEIDLAVSGVEQDEALFHFVARDGVEHTVWRVQGGAELAEHIAAISVCYVADGHHRVASAVGLGRRRRDADPEPSGNEEYEWFLAVLFPAGQLNILAYNRCVCDLGGLSTEAFLDAVQQRFDVAGDAAPTPPACGCISMYVDGKWFGLQLPGESAARGTQLDVDILQNQLLAPVLGIDDPRVDQRIDFIGGIRGTAELERRVDSGRCAVAFSMYPVSVEQMMAVTDAGRLMPPKSTWFEPKLRSGLLIHSLVDD